MIIVTGMDNSGKTTLAKQLSEELEMKVVKSTGPIPAAEQKEWVINQISGADERQAIFDRFPLFEEMVYGKVLRGKTNFKYGDPYFKLLRQINPLIVYTRPSTEKILQFGEREQMEGVIEKAEKLLTAYDEFIFKLMSDCWRVIPYNYEWNEPDEVAVAYGISKTMKGVVMLHG